MRKINIQRKNLITNLLRYKYLLIIDIKLFN